MDFTRNILCEATCFFKISTQKYQKFVSLDDLDKSYQLKKGAKWRVEKNRFYLDPKHRPKWCRKYNKKLDPQFYCLGPVGGMKCPFLIISNCRKEEYAHMGYGLSLLEKKAVKKYGKMFDYDDAMPYNKKETLLHEKVLKEFEKEKSLGPLKRNPYKK